MDRRAWLIAGATALGLAFVALVASAEPVQMFHEPTSTDLGFDFDPSLAAIPEAPEASPPAEGLNLPLVSVEVERLLVVALFVLLAVAVWWWLRRWFTGLPPEEEPDFDVLSGFQAAFADAAADQRHELLHGSPRNAIVACWVRLESCATRAGLQPDRAETSTELTSRVLAAYVVDRRAIDELAALYREARFSEHELTEAHRDRAVAALDDLARQLRRPTETAAPQP